MTIRVHVACDDETYRSVIANYLATEADIEIVGVSPQGQLGAAAVEVVVPDVVVLRSSGTEDPATNARTYRSALHGGAVVAFCAAETQAERYRNAGVEGVVLERDPARKLRAMVRASFKRARQI
jgi:DNA-binding NarL/FixJ family response regulator